MKLDWTVRFTAEVFCCTTLRFVNPICYCAQGDSQRNWRKATRHKEVIVVATESGVNPKFGLLLKLTGSKKKWPPGSPFVKNDMFSKVRDSAQKRDVDIKLDQNENTNEY